MDHCFATPYCLASPYKIESGIYCAKKIGDKR